MRTFTQAAMMAVVGLAAASAANAASAAAAKPTIVLVHGAFAESASWTGVVAKLSKDGYPVLAAANPLRSVAGDAAYVGKLLDSIKGPVVLVGHSYGGSVISVAAVGKSNVKSLVYVSAFAPETGESGLALSSKFPGSSLGDTLAPPVSLPTGGVDLYIQAKKFPHQFAADVAPGQAAIMAATQRPVTQAALEEPATGSAWKTIPSWSIYGSSDLNIPPKALAFMAQRAKSRHTVVVKGASHVVMVSHPTEVAALIEEAAR
ncbi:alpha/beta hydrolase [Phenylobacterium sp.]|uniref:alpha/beta fold hydrolase n=1 Tax=Phenylobacterium sp. TaxID=1871053 RepID=UPI00121F24DD|nr:alpha/beta hydrolase [Phenylobacterium sp.]THD60578.1 MAG: alpha/beta hydrolase [Phenylobacterium sp.]